MNIKTFDAAPSELRDKVRSGIVIYPLPDYNIILSDRIHEALKKIGIQSSHFSISDPTSVAPWCKAVGIQVIDTDSLLGVWVYDKDPETCIQVVREVVAEHIKGAIAL